MPHPKGDRAKPSSRHTQQKTRFRPQQRFLQNRAGGDADGTNRSTGGDARASSFWQAEKKNPGFRVRKPGTILLKDGGEGGIRTLGTRRVHTLSRRAPSATRTPLRSRIHRVAVQRPVPAGANIIGRRAFVNRNRARTRKKTRPNARSASGADYPSMPEASKASSTVADSMMTGLTGVTGSDEGYLG